MYSNLRLNLSTTTIANFTPKTVDDETIHTAGMKVTLSIPTTADGVLKLLEPGSLSVVASFHLFRIMQFVTHHQHHGLFAFTGKGLIY